MPKSTYSMGIDLGTSNTHAAILKHDRAENEPRELTIMIPSYVAFTSENCLVGSLAKLEADQHPSNTIYDAMRFLGRRSKDPETEIIAKQYPFRVVDNCGFAAFEVKYRDEVIIVTPVLVLSMILRRCLREAADSVGKGHTLLGVTITVPVAFDFSQRQLVRHAARIAGLGCVHIMDCTSAACLQYSRVLPSATRRVVLIIDCGAGFLDMSIAIDEDTQTAVKKAYGVCLRGIEDVNALLLDVLWEKVGASRPNSPAARIPSLQEVHWLGVECHSAKVKLSEPLDYESEVAKEVNSVYKIKMQTSEGASQGSLEITIGDLRRCFEGLLYKLSTAIPALLLEAQIKSSELTDVIFAGGTFSVSHLRLMLCGILKRHHAKWCPHPAAANAQGAAYHAATMLTAADPAYCGRRILVDVAPIPIYILLDGKLQHERMGTNEVSGISTTHAIITLTSMNEHTHHTLELWEGKESQQVQRRCLGKFTIHILSGSCQSSGVWIKAADDAEAQLTIIAQGYEDVQKQGIERLFICPGLTTAEVEETKTLFESLSNGGEDRFLARYVTISFVHAILKGASRPKGLDTISTPAYQSRLAAITSLVEDSLRVLWERSTKTATQHYSIRQKLIRDIQNLIDEGSIVEELIKFAMQEELAAIKTLGSMDPAEKKHV